MDRPEQARFVEEATGEDPSSRLVELTVIAPCLNEELNVPELSERILAVFERGGFRGELILVDDGSTDGTAAAIRALEARHPGVVRGVFHPKNRGIAAAWRSAAAAARGKLVSIIDADLQYQPEDLLRLRDAYYEHSVDIVQGWRSPVGRLKDQRYALSRGFNVLLNGLFSMSLRDNKSGFIVCPRAVMLDLLEHQLKYRFWQSFIMVAAHTKGYSYKEVETTFAPRKNGESFIDKAALRASVRSFSDLGNAVWEYRLNAPPPDVAANFLRHHPPARQSPPRAASSSKAWRAYLAAFNRTHLGITRDARHYLDTLEQTQWLSPDDTRELQDEKLRKLVRYCYRNVPHYRARMRASGVRPEDVGGQADLRALPILERADVGQTLYFDLMSEVGDKGELRRLSTSGGSGRPLVLYTDRVALEVRWAAAHRAAEWTGYRFGERAARLVDDSVMGPSRADAGREKAEAALANRLLLAIGELDASASARIARAIAAARPALLAADAEVLEAVARDMAAASGVGAVMSGGQTLGAEARAIIERGFGARVFDQYTSAELGTIAHACEEHAGLHVVAESCLVEILRADGAPAAPGETGDVVITGLDGYLVPLLRYRIGDRAVAMDPAACRCGRGSSRIGAVLGREALLVRGDGGRRVPGSFFFDSLRDQGDAIQSFSIRQTEDRRVQLRVVPAGSSLPPSFDEALAAFRRRLGPATPLEVEIASAAAAESQPLRASTEMPDS